MSNDKTKAEELADKLFAAIKTKPSRANWKQVATGNGGLTMWVDEAVEVAPPAFDEHDLQRAMLEAVKIKAARRASGSDA